MARKPKGPWWWEQRNQYAVRIRGKRHLLGADKEAAEKRFHELMITPDDPPPPKPDPKKLPLSTMIDRFLDWTEGERARETYLWYQKYLQSFLDSLDHPEAIPAESVKPLDVTKWIKSKKWGTSARRGAMTAVGRAYSWAFGEGEIEHNPVHRRLKKPRPGKREKALSPTDFAKVLANIEGTFKDLVVVAWETGARPQEIIKVEARHVDVDNGRWVFSVEESKGKKDQRIVFLSKIALDITKRLMKENPDGTLFRTRLGKPWDRFSMSNAFARLKKKIDVRYRLYDFRYSFCTNGLKNGVDSITMQHLMGHKDLSMISKIYALVGQDHDHMRKSAMKAATRAKK